MKAIRGATTIETDTADEIRNAIQELLSAIVKKNHLTEDNIICILFSNTSDIRSFYPAKAAREAGFSRCALYSSLEPEMDGALKKCLRVLVLAESECAEHVYLRRAANLRKDLKRFAIALDGPSGSGKSTVARLLAKSYNILYLDTGAMYRACALKAIRENIKNYTEDSIAPLMEKLDLQIKYADGTQHTILDGDDVSDAIRRPEVSMAASNISALRCVREKMVEMQRRIAQEQSCVLDGRDIGSYVLPNAAFKFFITATSEVRAKRRYLELKSKGFDVDFDSLLAEIELRDKNDSTRAFSPLKMAEDAILIDTSEKTIEEVVRVIEKKIQEKV